MKWISFFLGVSVLCFFPSANTLVAAQDSKCSPDSFETPREQSSEKVSDLLKKVDPATLWSQLPQELTMSLQKLSNAELEYQRSQWSNSALAAKEKILLGCPTKEMQTAIDEFYRVIYRTVVPDSFSLAQLNTPAFVNILKQSYLGTIAARRIFLAKAPLKLANVDWDGVSEIDSGRIPDFITYSDIKKYNAGIAESLRKLSDNALTEFELELKNSVLYEARALSVGAFSSNSHGGSDFESPCEAISVQNDGLRNAKSTALMLTLR